MNESLFNDGERLTALCKADKAMVAVLLETTHAAVYTISRLSKVDMQSIQSTLGTAAALKISKMSDEQLDKFIENCQHSQDDFDGVL